MIKFRRLLGLFLLAALALGVAIFWPSPECSTNPAVRIGDSIWIGGCMGR